MENREIKFRGKRINLGRLELGEWIHGYYVLTPLGDARIHYQPFSEATSNTYHEVSIPTVGQFTGLKDNNSKDVYEGDILEHVYDKMLSKWLIEWNEFRFELVNIGVDGYLGIRFPIERMSFIDRIMVGNIHDNPELLS